MEGMKNWLLHKATYDRSVSETLNAKLNQINLRCNVDPSTIPPMPEFLEELSQSWEPASNSTRMMRAMTSKGQDMSSRPPG